MGNEQSNQSFSSQERDARHGGTVGQNASWGKSSSSQASNSSIDVDNLINIIDSHTLKQSSNSQVTTPKSNWQAYHQALNNYNQAF